MAVHDICVIVVSHNGKRWLDSALTSLFEHSGGLDLDVVVVDNGSDGSAEYAEDRFQGVRALRCPNRGFGHANNRALETANARYVLFLNPDTEVLEGDLSLLTTALDNQPGIALVGVRQLRDDGSLAPSIRRFPSARHMLAEALGVEKIPGVRRVLGERELDMRQYDRVRPCDWTSGSFMLARQAALESTGWFDERFFLYSEETDLCWRLKRAGWEIVHMPGMTIRHHEHDQGQSSRLEAQSAYARMQFARKHFPRGAVAYRRALALRYALRVGLLYSVSRRCEGRAARAALATVLNGRPPLLPG
jgi:GT2 family glycosyltransferase